MGVYIGLYSKYIVKEARPRGFGPRRFELQNPEVRGTAEDSGNGIRFGFFG